MGPISLKYTCTCWDNIDNTDRPIQKKSYMYRLAQRTLVQELVQRVMSVCPVYCYASEYIMCLDRGTKECVQLQAQRVH